MNQRDYDRIEDLGLEVTPKTYFYLRYDGGGDQKLREQRSVS